MKKWFLMGVFALIGLLVFSACSRDGDSTNAGGEYTLKVLKSNGVALNYLVVVTNGQTHTEDLQNRALNSDYERTFSTGGIIAISLSATGNSDNSTLVAQLIKGGKVIKESTSKGKILQVNLSAP